MLDHKLQIYCVELFLILSFISFKYLRIILFQYFSIKFINFFFVFNIIFHNTL